MRTRPVDADALMAALFQLLMQPRVEIAALDSHAAAAIARCNDEAQTGRLWLRWGLAREGQSGRLETHLLRG